MKRLTKCGCGSGKFEEQCCGITPQVKMQFISVKNEQERQEILKNLKICSEFSMRYRGIFQYYGKELIAYKLEKPRDQNRNHFLRIISLFMSDFLANDCPSAWNQCHSSFWEELITIIFPNYIRYNPQLQEVEIFLNELKKYGLWLDKRTGTSCTPIINPLIAQFQTELHICEQLLHHLIHSHFPDFAKPQWNPVEAYKALEERFSQFPKYFQSVFEVKYVSENKVVLSDLDSNCTYQVTGIPSAMITNGLLINGVIGKRKGHLLWNWCFTSGIYPQKAKDYILKNYTYKD